MQKAQTAEFEPFDASNWRLGIVTAQFNKQVTQKLEDTAVARAADYGLTKDKIDIYQVSGSVELPLVLQELAKSGKYSALMAIGCVIRGATPHFDYVCKFVCEGVLRVQLDHDMPISFSVLTCNDEAEAHERAHLGGERLDAVLQQARLLRS